jgi:hypothetical protein
MANTPRVLWVSVSGPRDVRQSVKVDIEWGVDFQGKLIEILEENAKKAINRRR